MLMHHNEANGNTDVVIVTIDFFYISDSLLKHLGTAHDNEGSQFYLPPTGTVRVNEGDRTVLPATYRYSTC